MTLHKKAQTHSGKHQPQTVLRQKCCVPVWLVRLARYHDEGQKEKLNAVSGPLKRVGVVPSPPRERVRKQERFA